MLFECARRSEARLETWMVCDGGAIARKDRDRGGNCRASFGVYYAPGDGGRGASCGGPDEEHEEANDGLEYESHRARQAHSLPLFSACPRERVKRMGGPILVGCHHITV